MQLVQFIRVLLSNDTVFRFECNKDLKAGQIGDYICESLHPNVKELKLRNCRSNYEYGNQDLIMESVEKGDILVAHYEFDEEELEVIDLNRDYGANINSPSCVSSALNHVDDDDLIDNQIHNVSDILSKESFLPKSNNNKDHDEWRKLYLQSQCCGENSTQVIEPSSEKKQLCHADLLLHASLQLTENAIYYHQEIRNIYHAVRNFKRQGVCNVRELLPRLHKLVSQDRLPFFLSPGVRIVMAGWVECYENENFLWPVKKKLWAVLWDMKLALFKTEIDSNKYVVALSREKRGTFTKLGKRMIKEYAPICEININGWSARIADPNKCKQKLNTTEQCQMTDPITTFGLFDQTGKFQRVISVETAMESAAWVEKINEEAQEKLTKQKFLLKKANPDEFMKILSTCIRIPLKWLHANVDQIDKHAKIRRAKCATLSQAIKDVKRDSISINNTLFSGAFIEDILCEIALEVMKNAFNIDGFTEMDAVQFARRILIFSSRTQGGGDILDAVHLVLQNPNVCLCPDASTTEPINIKIFNQDSKVNVDVVVHMTFKVHFLDHSIGGIESDGATCGKIGGISTQHLVCNINSLPEVEGVVELSKHGT